MYAHWEKLVQSNYKPIFTADQSESDFLIFTDGEMETKRWNNEEKRRINIANFDKKEINKEEIKEVWEKPKKIYYRA